MKRKRDQASLSAGREMEEDTRTSLCSPAFKRALMDNLCYIQGRLPRVATLNDWYMALAYTVRDRVLQRWMKTMEFYMDKSVKSLSYFSSEFLMGPHLANNVMNLGISDEVRCALDELGLSFDELADKEPEPGLGNGGLGRLAACFLDSLATLECLAVGYGIRYEFGIFEQTIRDGWQVEATDKWLRLGNPWEIGRPELAFDVKFGGHTEYSFDEKGHYIVRWVPGYVVKGVAYDTLITGYRVNTVNLLRLWKAEACESFNFRAFNVGDYYGAVNEKVASENITKVLYPNDEVFQGRQLRLNQQYFFVSCSLQDLIRVHLLRGNPIQKFHELNAIQLNDTHPAIAVAELMRLLVDEHHLDWEKAWDITRNTFAYTNHTLLAEALEKWPVPLLGSLLPRHLEIIYEINRRFLDEVRKTFPADDPHISRLSLIDEYGERYVRMASLACVGSHAVNGVSVLHTRLLKQTVLCDFYALWPQKFKNVTNGVTPRRWVGISNPRLTSLITQQIGDGWIKNMEELKRLEEFVDDPGFQEEWRQVKFENKRRLAAIIKERTGVTVDPCSLFDIQVKRFHEYKRQHLNALHIITLYNRMKHNPDIDITPRTFIFGGKAAPGYFRAKLIIKLINSLGNIINKDPDVRDRIKVVFFPDFNVKNGQMIYPAADLSEQISTAGKEASGTGNMKFSMNGALTIGTLDGANVEIREEVGADNFFLFGLTAEQVHQYKSVGYHPAEYYTSNDDLRSVIDLIASGQLSPGTPELFKALTDSLLGTDEYMLMADYQSYVEAQGKVSRVYLNQEQWTRMSILNVARVGKFSSDRAVREYCDKIWKIKPVHVNTD
jgi:starch phosphorylase